MTIDYEKYRKNLSQFDMTDEKKDALIRLVYAMLQNRLDCAFGVDAVQLASTPSAMINLSKGKRPMPLNPSNDFNQPAGVPKE